MHQIREIQVEAFGMRQAKRVQQPRFLKGPIPMPQLADAAKLPGKCLAVYLAIRHQLDLSRAEEVKVPKTVLDAMGIDRDAKSRSLRLLEDAGLISVVRKHGCAAMVRLTS